MKQVKTWKEPWKKGEPGGRLSNRAMKDQKIMEKQAAEMKQAATQKIRVYCNKNLFLPGIFKSFTVNVSIPLREEEILEKMSLAFPGATILEGSK